jgi:hypothetical protein
MRNWSGTSTLTASQKAPPQSQPSELSSILLFIFFVLLNLSACAASPGPSVQDLVKIKTPTFSGSIDKSFTTPSQIFTLNGECDKLSHAIEYAIGSGGYKQIAPDCLNGTFSIPLVLIGGKTTILVRAKGKFSYSGSATAQIRFLLPPTAPYETMVQSSASDNSDLNGRGTQNVMELNLTGESSTSSANRMDFNLPGVVYAQ